MATMLADNLYEAVFSDALTFIATGETRELAFSTLLDSFEAVEAAELSEIMQDALFEARQAGVELEDIDPSWL